MFISLFIIITITFFLMKLMPGSPFNDAKLNAEQKEILNEIVIIINKEISI